LKNIVSFFTDKDDIVDSEYYNIPIPQLKSTVWLHDEPFVVKEIAYIFGEYDNDSNMIKVNVEHVEVEDFANFN